MAMRMGLALSISSMRKIPSTPAPGPQTAMVLKFSNGNKIKFSNGNNIKTSPQPN